MAREGPTVESVLQAGYPNYGILQMTKAYLGSVGKATVLRIEKAWKRDAIAGGNNVGL